MLSFKQITKQYFNILNIFNYYLLQVIHVKRVLEKIQNFAASGQNLYQDQRVMYEQNKLITMKN